MQWERLRGFCATFATATLVSAALLATDTAQAGRASATLSVRVVVVAPSCGADGGRDCGRTADRPAPSATGEARASREAPAVVRQDREGELIVRTLVY